MVIGIEDIVYCAAFCHEKLNILFLQPSNYFTGLFRETVGVTDTQSLDPDSTGKLTFKVSKRLSEFLFSFQDEKQRRIIIVINYKRINLSLYINEYFKHMKNKRLVS